MTSSHMTREEAEEARAYERFTRDTAEHQMTVIHDVELYRHLRFQKPGTSIYFYDLVTWPGYLAIVGDAGDYLFSRIRDMFEFFGDGSIEGGRGINPGYWSEKLQGPGGQGMAMVYSERRYKELAEQWLEQVTESRELGGKAQAKLRCEVQAQLLSGGIPYNEEEARRALHYFECEGMRLDSWEWDLRDFDTRFLWCCWAIVSGIGQYKSIKEKS